MSGAHNGLRSGLAGLADEVQVVDLRAGTLRASRRLRRLRAAAGAGIAAVLLAAGGGVAMAVLPRSYPAPTPQAGQSSGAPATTSAAPAADAIPGLLLYNAGNSPDHELWRRPSGGQWQRISTVTRPQGADWRPSPDGRSVAFVDGGRLWIRDLGSGAKADVAAAAPPTCGGLVWSGDARRIVVVEPAPNAPNHVDLVAVDRDGSGRRTIAAGLGEAGHCTMRRPVASPDGRFVAVVTGGAALLVPMDGSGARTVAAQLPAGQWPSAVVAVDNAGTRMLLATEPAAAAACCNQYLYWLLDVATGRTTPLAAATDPPMSGGFAPDGRVVLLTAALPSGDGRTQPPVLTAYAADGSGPIRVELPQWVYEGLVLQVTDR